MAALPPVAGVLKAQLFFTIQGKVEQGLRFFYNYTGTAPSSTNCVTLSSDIFTEAESAIIPLLGGDNYLTSCVVTDLSSDTGAVGETTGDTEGTYSGDPVPSGAAVVCSYEILRRYRGGHPRSYWPLGTSSALLGDALWDSTFVDSVKEAVSDTIGSIFGVTAGPTTVGEQVNVSYYQGFTSVENPLTHRYRNVPTLRATPQVDVVQSIIARSYVGSLRKRRPKTS